MRSMRIAVGADDSHPLVQAVLDWCTADGHTVDLVADRRAWPDVGRLVGEAVTSGAAERGVVMCWTGTGVSIAANKVPGVRAALCADAETARGARRWNDANVLALSMRGTSPAVAEEILAAFVRTDDVDPDEAIHIAAVS
jgi:ribose 5-phosphate isomerase B